MRSSKGNLGFTLVELMVALAISSVLLLAVMQNFLTAKRAYRLDEGLALLQENGRFSSEILGRTLRMAGYYNDPGLLPGGAFPNDATFATAGQIVVGTDNNVIAGDNVLDGTDTITIRYLANGDGTPTDCLGGGAGAAAGFEIVNTFYIMPAALTTSGTNEFHCTSNVSGDSPIADGVDNMQILYGVDTTGNQSAGIYLNAAGTAAAWNGVVGVRVSLLLNTVNPSTKVALRTYTLLDSPILPFTDGMRRQIFTSTIGFRNVMQ